jgi:hypothetical protein
MEPERRTDRWLAGERVQRRRVADEHEISRRVVKVRDEGRQLIGIVCADSRPTHESEGRRQMAFGRIGRFAVVLRVEDRPRHVDVGRESPRVAHSGCDNDRYRNECNPVPHMSGERQTPRCFPRRDGHEARGHHGKRESILHLIDREGDERSRREADAP